MHERKRWKAAGWWLVVVMAAAVGCRAPAEHGLEDAPPRIDADRARSLVLERYRALFGRKYHRDREGYYEFPQLAAEDFTQVRLEKGAWYVRYEPPAGYYVVARVGIAGDWVDLLRVGFANH